MPQFPYQVDGSLRGEEPNPNTTLVTRRRLVLPRSGWGSWFTGRLGAGQEFFN